MTNVVPEADSDEASDDGRESEGACIEEGTVNDDNDATQGEERCPRWWLRNSENPLR